MCTYLHVINIYLFISFIQLISYGGCGGWCLHTRNLEQCYFCTRLWMTLCFFHKQICFAHGSIFLHTDPALHTVLGNPNPRNGEGGYI